MDSQNIPLHVGTADNNRKLEVSLLIVYNKLSLTLKNYIIPFIGTICKDDSVSPIFSSETDGGIQLLNGLCRQVRDFRKVA